MRTLVLAALMVCAGCTTLKPVAGTPPELREKIDSGQLLKAGDRVLIVTTDAKAHRFAVTTIQAGAAGFALYAATHLSFGAAVY